MFPVVNGIPFLIFYSLCYLQVVTSIDKDEYDAQKVASNLTIQHTVADALEDVIPERVTDIVVEEEEEGGRSSFRNSGGLVSSAVTARPVRLKYKISMRDPLYTVEKVRTKLVQAVMEGKMDSGLRFYAAQFGATGLTNGTFAVPLVTNAAVQRDSSSQLTGVMIALLVIGVIMAVTLITAWSWFGFRLSA